MYKNSQESIRRNFEGPYETLIPPESPMLHYALKNGFRDHPVSQRLAEVTHNHPMSIMLATPDEVAMMQFLLRLIHAKKVIEIGM